MNFKKVMPQPSVYNTNMVDVNNITEEQFEKVVMTPVGLKHMESMSKEMANELVKSYQLKLHRSENKIAAIHVMMTVDILEEIFNEAKQDGSKRGWQKSNLSIDEIVKKYITKLTEEDRNGKYDNEKAFQISKHIDDRYNLTVTFDDIDINKEFGFEQICPYVDDNVFGDITMFDAHDLGACTADATCRLFMTHSVYCAMREDKRFTPSVIRNIFDKANQILKDRLQKYGVSGYIREARKHLSIPDELEKNVLHYAEFEKMSNDRWKWLEVK